MTTTATQHTAEQQVRSLIQDVYAAWEANDAAAFAALYTPEATAALPGSFRNGREAIRAEMAAGFAGPLKGSTVRDRIDGVRLLGADAQSAIVTARSAVGGGGPGAGPPPGGGGAPGGAPPPGAATWQVAAYHNCAD
ncbi:SgcJ/EcaC family oxidoreductase [Yinghuangia soli]|uniref:SgcJ/EcaC family oxidoreductase n=1 Tax=Yinghuangia soli TaxID=2908204 RepID=A0AA41PYW0_9ACTN|nr:SgcJ/EcaC family oxidoreductase [Yinghuangia soli]MCF2528415.1 SgcJ/EcaC family oxidoreductase [Yinghuangia soli]